MGNDYDGDGSDLVDTGTFFVRVPKRRLGKKKPGVLLCGHKDEAGGEVSVCKRPAPCPDHSPVVKGRRKR